MGLQEFRCHLLAEAGDLVEVFGQDAGLVVVEGVDVNGGVALVGLDIVDLAAIHALGPVHRLGDAVAAGVVVADHTEAALAGRSCRRW